MAPPQRIRTFNSRTTEKQDNVTSSVVPEHEIQQRQEDTKNRLAYVTKHPFASSWTWKQIQDFENKGEGVSINGKIYYPDSYKPRTTTISQDNKSAKEHRAGQQRAKQELDRQKQIKEQNAANDVINETVGWIPGVNAFTRIGLSQWADRTGNPRAREYDLSAALGLAGDAATIYMGGTKPLQLATSYAGAKAGKAIGKEYGYPLLGELIGATVGGGPVYNIGRDIVNTGKQYMTFRDLLRSVRETPIYNWNVEHASPYGRTIGSQMNVHTPTDIGIHVSDIGSETTRAIQSNSEVPLTVREGVLTTSPNTLTKYTGQDKGLWTSVVNPELYENVRPWSYPVNLSKSAEDAIRLSEDTPIIQYTNGWESSDPAYLISDPNYLQLSKNEVLPIQGEKLRLRSKGISPINIGQDYLQNISTGTNHRGNPYIFGSIGDDSYLISKWSPNNYYVGFGNNASENFSSIDDVERFLESQHNNYLKTLEPMQKQAYLERPFANDTPDAPKADATEEFKKAIQDQVQLEVEDFYKSPQYEQRYVNIIPNKRTYEHFTKGIQELANKINPVSFKDNSLLGYSQPININQLDLGINVRNPRPEQGFLNTISHEFGHHMYRDYILNDIGQRLGILQMINHNNGLIGDALKHLNPGVPIDEFTKYISEPNELRQRLIPYVKKSLLEDLTPEETYNEIIDENLLETFNKDYLIKLIGGLLSVNLLLKNNDSQS